MLEMFKAMKGGGGGIAPMLAAMGIKIKQREVAAEEQADAFLSLALATRSPGSKVLELAGEMKGGEKLKALLVLVPSPAVEKKS